MASLRRRRDGRRAAGAAEQKAKHEGRRVHARGPDGERVVVPEDGSPMRPPILTPWDENKLILEEQLGLQPGTPGDVR